MATDPGPMARFADVKGDALAPEVIFQRLSEGETLREIAKAWRLPKGPFMQWYTTEHADLYDAALKVLAADMAIEALRISDEQAEVVKENGESFDPNVGRDKLRIETRLKLASKWDRARYGEAVKIERSVTIGVDAGLLTKAGELLTRLSKLQAVPLPRVIEQAEDAEVLPPLVISGT